MPKSKFASMYQRRSVVVQTKKLANNNFNMNLGKNATITDLLSSIVADGAATIVLSLVWSATVPLLQCVYTYVQSHFVFTLFCKSFHTLYSVWWLIKGFQYSVCNWHKSGDKKPVRREGIRPISRVFTYFHFSVTHSL